MKNPFDHIEDYLAERLSAEQKQHFETLLADDAALQAEVNLASDLQIGIKSAFDQRLKETLVAADKNSAQIQRRNKIVKIWSSIGVAVAVMISLGIFLLQPKMDSLSLFGDLYEHYPNIIDRVQRANGQQQMHAFQLYDQQKYTEALDFFSRMSDTVEDVYPSFYEGICRLELDDAKGALRTFESIDQNRDQRFTDAIQWYTALAYIKLDQKKAAQNILEQLSQTKNAYQQKAADVLTKL